MTKNVPFDVAMSLSGAECLAYRVIIGGFEGGKFDWHRMQWEEPK